MKRWPRVGQRDLCPNQYEWARSLRVKLYADEPRRLQRHWCARVRHAASGLGAIRRRSVRGGQHDSGWPGRGSTAVAIFQLTVS